MSSVAPVSVKTGQVAPPELGLTQCEELGALNQEARTGVVNSLKQKQTASGLNDAETATLAKASGTGMTFSSAASSITGGEGALSGCSNALARSQVPGIVIHGGTSAQQGGLSLAIRLSHDEDHDDAKEAAGVLCGKSHVHPGGGFGAHAEPKIINHLTNLVGADNMRGGSLLFNIDWRSARYGRSGMPCPHCFKMLCHAASECDIRIFVCSEHNEPVEISSSDCKEPDAYEDLCQSVDGDVVPGR